MPFLLDLLLDLLFNSLLVERFGFLVLLEKMLELLPVALYLLFPLLFLYLLGLQLFNQAGVLLGLCFLGLFLLLNPLLQLFLFLPFLLLFLLPLQFLSFQFLVLDKFFSLLSL
jgi:hypothetical protein